MLAPKHVERRYLLAGNEALTIEKGNRDETIKVGNETLTIEQGNRTDTLKTDHSTWLEMRIPVPSDPAAEILYNSGFLNWSLVR